MKTMTKQTIALSALIAGLCAVPAMADDSGLYALGQVTHVHDTAGNKDSANGLGLDLGYRFNKNFALEGGYTGFQYRDGMSSDKSLNFRAVGILPVATNVDLFAKAGVARVGRSFGDGATDDLTYGVGASYKLDRNWALRVDYDRLKDTGDQHLNTFSAGAEYHF